MNRTDNTLTAEVPHYAGSITYLRGLQVRGIDRCGRCRGCGRLRLTLETGEVLEHVSPSSVEYRPSATRQLTVAEFVALLEKESNR